MNRLAGKTIVVVGGTTGLGLSAARAFVESGARVVVLGRNRDSLITALAELGPAAAGEVGDACEPEPVERAIQLAENQFGPLTGLYHVAGGSGRSMGDGPLHAVTESGWDETVRLNLRSVFLSNRAAVRAFREHKAGGTVVNCGSVLGFSPAAEHFSAAAYAASKAAIIGFTKSSAATYVREGIRFNVLAPGLVATPMSRRAQESEEILAYARGKQPLAAAGMGHVDDVVGTAVYLMSDESRAMTGQVMTVDWGWTVSEGASST